MRYAIGNKQKLFSSLNSNFWNPVVAGDTISREEETTMLLLRELELIQSSIQNKLEISYIPADITQDANYEQKYKETKQRIIDLCRAKEFCFDKRIENLAIKTLNLLDKYKILPSLVNPTSDESLLFEMFSNGNSFSLDLYKSGEIVFLKRIKGHNTVVAEIDEAELEEICEEISRDYAR
jgi:hypothetical protein